MLDRDGSILSKSKQERRPRQASALKRGYAEINQSSEDQVSRISQLMAVAFDQLGFRSLELRVTESRDDQKR